MAKYRKKPVVIDAVEWRPNAPLTGYPIWFADVVAKNPAAFDPQTGNLGISTLEGVMLARPGDFIIRGVKGELYPCKPDIFAATYEPVDRPPDAATRDRAG